MVGWLDGWFVCWFVCWLVGLVGLVGLCKRNAFVDPQHKTKCKRNVFGIPCTENTINEILFIPCTENTINVMFLFAPGTESKVK